MSIKKKIIGLIYGVFRILPVRKNTVLLFSYYGEQYSGSPKYIGKYLSQETNLEVVWAFVDPKRHQDVSGKIIRYGHIAYYFFLATAGTIVTNFRMTEEFHKRTSQIYVQTWHGSCPLKRVEKDAKEELTESYIKMAKWDAKQTDLMLADSRLGEEVFKQAFWYHGVVARSGLPEYDILFNKDMQLRIKNKVYAYFDIPDECHILLYAPTFRKNQQMDIYDLDVRKLTDALHERFSGKWYVMVRLHPHLANKYNQLTYMKDAIFATKYDDVQELIMAADFIISDYSSVMFSSTITNTPCMLYTPDIKEYTTGDRGLYVDIDKLPFKHCEKQKDLYLEILKFDAENYEHRITTFLKEIGNYSDGNSSRKAVEAILNLRKM